MAGICPEKFRQRLDGLPFVSGIRAMTSRRPVAAAPAMNRNVPELPTWSLI